MKVSTATAKETILILPDIHFPEQNDKALAVVLEAALEINPTKVILLGDMADCTAFGTHPSASPEEVKDWLATEVMPLGSFLDRLRYEASDRGMMDDPQFVLLEGNHEARIQRELAKLGPVGMALRGITFESQLRAQCDVPFEWVPYNKTAEKESFYEIVKPTRRMKSGGLVAVHGWSYAKYAAAKHLEMARDRSIVFGHCHRRQEHTTRDRFGDKMLVGWCPGTLSKLQPFWKLGGQPTEHTNGFSIVYVGDNSWTHYTVSISKGECVLPNGTHIRG